eukprot:scaffold810_cov355-Pavlova_lutheri.AAC.1
MGFMGPFFAELKCWNAHAHSDGQIGRPLLALLPPLRHVCYQASVRDTFHTRFLPVHLVLVRSLEEKRVVERLGRSLVSGLLSLSFSSEEFLSVGVVGELLAGRPEQLATEKNGAPSSREKGTAGCWLKQSSILA